MICFVNGKQESFRTQPTELPSPRTNSFHALTISKPNSNNVKEQMPPMKFDQFVTWTRVLAPAEITKAFSGGRFKKGTQCVLVRSCVTTTYPNTDILWTVDRLILA